MATDRKISDLDSLAVAPAANDELEILDNSEALDEDKNKRITIQDLFGFLGDGNFTGDIVLDTGATIDLSLGTIHINEAVDLVATSTELNQLAGVTVGGVAAGDIVDIDSAQVLSNKTLTAPTIADFTNANHDHSNVAGGGNLGNITTGSINALDDTDASFIFGRARIGYDGVTADVVNFSHYDHGGPSTYALNQDSLGNTNINAVTGQAIGLRVNNVNIFDINGSGLAGAAGARVTQFDDDAALAADSSTRGVTQAAVKGYVDTRPASVFIEVFDPTTAASTGNDQAAVVIPDELNGYDLTRVIVGVTDLGTGGTQDVMIHRRRAGVNVDMLTAAVTVDPTEYFAEDGTIDTANDDVQTGDTVVVDIDAVHSTTPANGTFVTLVFTLP